MVLLAISSALRDEITAAESVGAQVVSALLRVQRWWPWGIPGPSATCRRTWPVVRPWFVAAVRTLA